MQSGRSEQVPYVVKPKNTEGGRVYYVAESRCECGNIEEVSMRARMPPEIVLKKFAQKDWRVRGKHMQCPHCQHKKHGGGESPKEEVEIMPVQTFTGYIGISSVGSVVLTIPKATYKMLEKQAERELPTIKGNSIRIKPYKLNGKSVEDPQYNNAQMYLGSAKLLGLRTEKLTRREAPDLVFWRQPDGSYETELPAHYFHKQKPHGGPRTKKAASQKEAPKEAATQQELPAPKKGREITPFDPELMQTGQDTIDAFNKWVDAVNAVGGHITLKNVKDADGNPTGKLAISISYDLSGN